MLKNLMDEKKLDFDAPLLSVRRLTAEAAAAETADASSSLTPSADGNGEDNRKPAPAPRRFSVPFYKSEVKSGPVCHPGVVPFVWEQMPGQPKNGGGRRPPAAPKPPPGSIFNDKETHSSRDAKASPTKHGSRVRTHKAAAFRPSGGAATSSEAAKKDDLKQVEAEKVDEKPQQRPPPTRDGGDDDDDEDVFTDAPDTLSRTESFFMNCSVSGLSSFRDPPQASTEPQVQDFMMARFLPAAQALASDSPQFTFRKPATPAREPTRATDRIVSENLRWSPLLHHHNQVSHFAGEQDYDDAGEEDEDCDEAGRLPSRACGLLPKFCLKSSFCLLNPFPGMKHRGRPPLPRRKGSQSPKINNSHQEHSWEAVYRDKQGKGHQSQVEGANSRLTSESNHLSHWSDSPTADGSLTYQRSDGGISPYRYEAPPSPFCEGRGFLGVPSRESKSSKNASSGVHEEMPFNERRHGQMDDIGNLKIDVIHNGPRRSDAGDLVENSVSPLQSPLLMPKSPSESWLLHTLPSVSSKTPKPESFLGLRFQPRKQPLRAFCIDPKHETNAKPSKPQRRKMRNQEVLAMPLFPKSQF